MAQTRKSLLVGVATADITPPVGVTLSGYKPRTSTGIAHPLRAEALVCKDPEGGAWALVTSDVIEYQRGHVQDIRRMIADRTALRPEAILIAGTHTHSGPSTVSFGADTVPDVDTRYNKTLKQKLADLVVAAAAAASPATFEVAWTEARELASNRRIQKDDGTWTNEWQDPDGRHPGYVDPAVLLVGVRREDGRRDALLVNYGCHPVTLGPSSLDISPDYVGYLKNILEAEGAAGTAMFALAGAGNVNPRLCIQVGAEHPKANGEKLAAIVLNAADRLQPIAGGKVAAHQQPWNIVRTRDVMKRKNRPNTKVGDTVETEIQAFRAGDLALVSLPGELFSEFNPMLREASPVPYTVVVSLANDYVGYLPTDEAQDQGAYETNMAPAVGLEGLLMNTARKALSAIA